MSVVLLNLAACNGSDNFRERGQYVIGEIYRIDYVPRGSSYSIRYQYFVADSLYKNSASFFIENKNLKDRLLNSTFCVIYLPEKPNISRILITKRDFKLLDLSYPDSLSWVEDYR